MFSGIEDNSEFYFVHSYYPVPLRDDDVLRLQHRAGDLYFINLLSMGFAADVAVMTNRRFKSFGALAYLLVLRFLGYEFTFFNFISSIALYFIVNDVAGCSCN